MPLQMWMQCHPLLLLLLLPLLLLLVVMQPPHKHQYCGMCRLEV
jgi:hypothetical protein